MAARVCLSPNEAELFARGDAEVLTCRVDDVAGLRIAFKGIDSALQIGTYLVASVNSLAMIWLLGEEETVVEYVCRQV